MGTLRMRDLTQATGMTPRGVRHYVKMGILPRPEGRGTGPVYTAEHLLRLRAARRMRAENVPLRDIAVRLRKVSAEELARLGVPAPIATATADAPGASPFAVGIAASTTTGFPPRADGRTAGGGQGAAAGFSSAGGQGAAAGFSVAPNPTDGGQVDAVSYPSERWERVGLLAGLELHVRTDASALIRRLAAEIHARYGAAP